MKVNLNEISEYNLILQGMFTDATEGILVSSKSGEIILSNPRVQKLFGYSEIEMKTLHIEDLMPGRFAVKHKHYRDDYNQNPEPKSMGNGRELWAKRKDGTEFPVEISLSYVKRDTDLLHVAFIIDITERKKKDDELKKANELFRKTSLELSKLNRVLEQKVNERTLELAEMIKQLTESQKETDLALQREKDLNFLKSRFISTASHEFRTPLATIMSSVSLAAKYFDTNNKDQLIKHIDRVKKSVKHLTEILNDLLSLDKLEEGAVSPGFEFIHPEDILNTLSEELKGIVKPGQKIKLKLNHKGGKIYTDPKIFRNVLINLISNAIKYSHENTLIEIGSLKSDGIWKFTVKDQGIGIPETDKAHIFERFYRANNIGNEQGTGLGLNIVKKYMEILGGKIYFESEPNKGTIFTIELPE